LHGVINRESRSDLPALGVDVYFNIFLPFPGTEIYENAPFKFTTNEYPLFSKDSKELLEKYPDKFKFAAHNVDLAAWRIKNFVKYNTLPKNLPFYFSLRYWRTIFFSKNKINYLTQFVSLIKEFLTLTFYGR